MQSFLIDFEHKLAEGKVDGHRLLSVGGRNPDLDTGVGETIRNQGGIYTYLSTDTQLYASSSSGSDTAVTLAVAGLDSSGNEITRTVTLNGQNQVALSGTMYRVFAAQVTGSTQAIGNVYIAESDSLTAGVPDTASKIKAKIDAGKGISQNGIYTVPAGYVAILKRNRIGINSSKEATYTIKIRTNGSVWLTVAEFPINQALEFNYIGAGLPLPALTDLEYYAVSTANDAVVVMSQEIMLIKTTHL